MSLVDLIKQASLGAVEAANPVAVLFGTVTKTNPLEVNVDQRFTLTNEFLIVPEQLTEYRVTINGQNIIIRRGLQTGDKVLLLRMQGGHRYVILDRVV